ncbi:hypothetical protein SEA_LIBERTYBELL_64 [Streptomyces phage LibertyBell]|nr:hypothetical protein SEA_LIBERTYBELL_64 [Streptomyces phage LibertyBell]
MTEFPDSYVQKFQRMDPKTEELLTHGEYLADGMVVLVEPRLRVDLKRDHLSDWEVERAFENNQWCTVSNVEYDSYHRVIMFVGTYADGTKIKRSFGRDYSWVVKIDSLSDSMQLATARYQNLHAMVGGLLASNPPASEFFDDQVEETTRQILKLFGGI